MLIVTPGFYDRFSCIASRCAHSCCVGWEIDVDAKTRSFYASVPGKLGEELASVISRGRSRILSFRRGSAALSCGRTDCAGSFWIWGRMRFAISAASIRAFTTAFPAGKNAGSVCAVRKRSDFCCPKKTSVLQKRTTERKRAEISGARSLQRFERTSSTS